MKTYMKNYMIFGSTEESEWQQFSTYMDLENCKRMIVEMRRSRPDLIFTIMQEVKEYNG